MLCLPVFIKLHRNKNILSQNMNVKEIVKLCKELGCCDACCLRYIGVRKEISYGKCHELVAKYLVDTEEESDNNKTASVYTECEPTVPTAPLCSDDGVNAKNGVSKEQESPSSPPSGSSSPPLKRRKTDVCTSCLGILQEDTWLRTFEMAKEAFDKKGYECQSFAAALSSPMAILIREKAIVLYLKEKHPEYDDSNITPLKESWKWSFAERLASHIGRRLDSGAVAQLMVTLNMEYQDDAQELEILKTLSPSVFTSRNESRRFVSLFTRPAVEQALRDVTSQQLKAIEGWERGVAEAKGGVECASVIWNHMPVYLGGRYVKLSRRLPQTPWRVESSEGESENGPNGIIDSSVQQIIFEPLLRLLNMTLEESESRLKLISAGREDVDVRCLGRGRPFAIEILDPRRQLSEQELKEACDVINSSQHVIVKEMVYVNRDDLALLKKGEQTKCKTYEALCIKLGHSNNERHSSSSTAPVTVTESDIDLINSYRNTPPSEDARIVLDQKTPIRVLHRRPLLSRRRHILEMKAFTVPDHPQLFVVRLRTDAGTYVKEWVHGELGRTSPSLASVIGAPVDILALDVIGVHLDWPVKNKCE